MSSCECFEQTLHYSSPGHGDWGIVRIGMLVPESVMLFVSPAACGRHGALGAMQHGYKDRVYYCYLTQADIVKGYDDLILETVDRVLKTIKIKPKAFYIFVSCLDDLIGTDHPAVLEELHRRHPGIQFRDGHMNPLALDTKTPPGVSIQNNLYSFLNPAVVKDNGVNLMGSFEKVLPTSELYDYLASQGVTSVRHIGDYKTFDAYQDLAKSRANIVLSPAAKQSAGLIEKRLGTPNIFLPVTYDLDEIEENYQKIQDFLFPGKPLTYDFSAARQKAQDAIDSALVALKDLPIYIDVSATFQPFGLGKALLNYGFNVAGIGSDGCPAFDRAHMEWIETQHSEVHIFNPVSYKVIRFDHVVPDSLALGIEGAYLTKSKYVADLFGDLGMFGYDAVTQLMRLMEEGVQQETDLKQMLDDYGLVV